MDIKEFAQEFLDNINVAVEMGNTDYDQVSCPRKS